MLWLGPATNPSSEIEMWHVTDPMSVIPSPVYLRQSGIGADVVVGGRSYGGRVASLAAAAPENEFGGLLLFAYPLHRPGFREQLRTEHWPRIRCPVLLIQGESDPFGSPDEVH